jgi:branched-chain amino acid transport system substrate-binding protein
MKKVFVILMVLVLASAIAFASGSTESAETATIKIGAALSQTGTNVHGGTQALNAMKLLIDEVNAAGGIKGHQIELFVENTNSEAEQAVNGALKLANENNVLAILGPDNGTTATAIKTQVAEVYEVPQISVVGSSPKLTADNPKWFFRGATPSTYQSVELAAYLVKSLGKQRIAILCDDSLKDQATSFTKDLESNGVTYVSMQSHATGNTNFNGQLLATKNANPDAIMFIGYPTECASALKQAHDMGLDVQWAGSIGTVYQELINLSGSLSEGFLGTIGFTATNPDPVVKAFVEKYVALYGELPEHTAGQAYDQLSLVLKAIEECEIGFTKDTLAKDRALIRDWLETKANGYEGLAGVIKYDANEHTAYKSINLMIIENGAWKVLQASN